MWIRVNSWLPQSEADEPRMNRDVNKNGTRFFASILPAIASRDAWLLRL